MNQRRLRWVAAGCLLAGALVFLISVTRENEDTDRHDPETELTEHAGDEGDEANEASERGEGAEAESEEAVLGVDVESAPVVALACLLAVGLAVAALVRPSRPLWIAIVAFGLVALVLDIGELAHQVDEDQTGIATLAAAVGLLHLGAAAGAAMLLAGVRSVETEPSRH